MHMWGIDKALLLSYKSKYINFIELNKLFIKLAI